MKIAVLAALLLTGCATADFSPEAKAWCAANGGDCHVTTEQKMKELFMRGYLIGREAERADAKGGV